MLSLMLICFTSLSHTSATQYAVSAFSVLHRALAKVGFNFLLSYCLSALIGAFNRVLTALPAVVSGNELVGTFLVTEFAKGCAETAFIVYVAL